MFVEKQLLLFIAGAVVTVPAVEYIVPGYILVSRSASLLVRREVPVTTIFWTPFGNVK